MSILGLEMKTSSQELIKGSNISKPQRRQIVRGKRTERSRPLTAVTSSSSTGCTGGGNDAYFSTPSPTSSGQNNSTCTEEDEDMASCLILLAQSSSCPKLISQKFTETARTTATTGKTTGFYVYECKTCNRNFSSFQALGGHRASHKKPKVPIPEENNKVHNATLNHNREDVQFNKVNSPSIFPSKSLQSGTNKAKVHECSICGSEFASGQALGGHMRRHRITTPTNGNSCNIIDNQNNKPLRNILQLDLNLPAPEDDDHVDSKFPFVFSAQALVGCHY